MPLFYFILKAGQQIIPDHEGVELPDQAAARLHAATVAQQLMRHREISTRRWRIQVCDDYLQPLFDVFFAEVDETLKTYPARFASSIGHVARTFASFNDALHTIQGTLKDVRLTLARANRMLGLPATRE